MWDKVDKLLYSHYIKYKDIRKETKDELEDIFNEFDIDSSSLNKNIPKSKKEKLNRKIKKVLGKKNNSYLYFFLSSVLNSRNITYMVLLEALIDIAYYSERKKLDEIENLSLYSTNEIFYNTAINEIKELKPKKKDQIKPFRIEIQYIVMNMPLFYGYKDTYMYLIANQNANEMYKLALNYIQRGKTLNLEDKNFKNIIEKQDNRYLKPDTHYGTMETMTETFGNKAYLQAGLDNDIEKCKFIAVMDDRTTKMCRTLDNQVFYLNKVNDYYRYSDIDKKIVEYHTKGLKTGENLPPIDNHYHLCRSTITYQLDMPQEELNNNLMTYNEKSAISKWISSDFYTINKKMYSGEELTKEEKQLVKNLYRGLNKVPYYDAKKNEYIVRCLEISDIESFKKEYPINKIHVTKAFESYSIASNYNPNANVFLYVKGSKKARNMLEYNPEEKEVLYQYGTRFVTKSVYEKDDKYYFLLEEIPNE